jgi:hypothetical protein
MSFLACVMYFCLDDAGIAVRVIDSCQRASLESRQDLGARGDGRCRCSGVCPPALLGCNPLSCPSPTSASGSGKPAQGQERLCSCLSADGTRSAATLSGASTRLGLRFCPNAENGNATGWNERSASTMHSHTLQIVMERELCSL